MSRPKRQHYVPQFLLRHFTAVGELERLWVFDKRQGETRLQAIRDSGHETHFYECPDLDRVGINLEGALAEFEGVVAPVLARIGYERSLLPITSEHRGAIVDFILVQLFRTRSAREFAKQGSRIVLGEEITEDIAQQACFASLLRDFSRYRAMSTDHILTLREVLPPQRLLPGDAVALLVRDSNGPSESLSAILPTATICVPISPSLCLTLFPGARERDLVDAGAWYRPDIRVLTEGQPTMPNEADSINTMSVVAANRFVYSATQDFQDCKNAIAAYPSAKHGPIGRWVDIRRSDGDE